MRLLLLFLACGTVTAIAGDAPVTSDIRPERTYATSSAIETWASKVSFGGYRVISLKHKTQNIEVVLRGFSSGVPTTDISVFVESSGHWTLALWLPVRNEGLDVKQQDEGIEIYAYGKDGKTTFQRLYISYDALSSIRG
jgi:hypothetical protein